MARNVITIVNQDKKTITLTDKVSGNAVSVNTTTRKKIEAKTEATQVTVENQLTNTVQVLRQQGPRGIRGEKGAPGLLAHFEDLLVVGSLNTTSDITGSFVKARSGFIGNLTGTASFAESASYALSSSFSSTASFVESSSFATTASFALNVPADTGFPFTGSAEITGSLNVIGPITASVVSSSGLVSASAFYGDGSHLLGLGQNIFPFTGSAEISGSLNVEGSLTASSLGFMGDVSASTYFGDGGNLTGIGSQPFPYT